MTNDVTTTRGGNKHPICLWIVKIVLWTLMTAVLIVYGTITATVTLLGPDKLTPLVKAAANRYFDAAIGMSRVELTALASYPFLRIEIDSVEVVSGKMTALKATAGNDLPDYADTLFTLERFVGEVNLPALLRGKLRINDVRFIGPEVNIVIADPHVNNFDIMPAQDAGIDTADVDDTDPSANMPSISIRHFSIDSPKRFRYYDATDGTQADLDFSAVVLDGEKEPTYRLDFGGCLYSPLLGRFNLGDFPFSINGDITWDPAIPHEIRLDDFYLKLAFLSSRFDTDLDFKGDVKVKRLNLKTDPINIDKLLTSVPDSMLTAWRLDREIKTDAELTVSLKLDSAYSATTGKLPFATVGISIPDCKISYGRARFEHFATELTAILRGDDINAASFELTKLDVAGPATRLKIAGNFREVATDPMIDIRINGYTDIAKLPPPLLNAIDGSITGRITAALSIKGRPSMLDRNRFHRLNISGDIDADEVKWRSADTTEMAYINNACLKFGTNESFGGADSLLTATVKVDSADACISEMKIRATGLSLGIGASNRHGATDTTTVTPMGGGIRLSTFLLDSPSDSMRIRIRDIAGRVSMRRFNDMAKVPEFVFDLGIKRIAAGSPEIRALMGNSNVHFSAHKLPGRRPSKALERTADSIMATRPELPADSAYRLAIEHLRLKRKGSQRPRTGFSASESEMIDWGTSKAMGRLLLRWGFEGKLASERAGLFTPYFPLRNRIGNLNVTFNNDSIVFSDISYKAGSSDFMASGSISNIKRSFTSRRSRAPLKIRFETVSDTIDVNQLAESFFKGSAYAKTKETYGIDIDELDSDEQLEQAFERLSDTSTDSVSPLLIPVNIEADISVKAANILYSDLLLHKLSGKVLVYDGALNMRRLAASSDIGSIDLSALYSAPDEGNIKFGFGMKVKDFDINRFMGLMPALDTIMPLMRDIAGIIDADVAATVDIDDKMDFVMPTLAAAIKLEGDSLRLLDAETFRTVAKWLMFKDKKTNIIDHMSVELIVDDNQMQIFPFMFDMDRYRLGIQGYNDLAMNFNYNISVLKSPLPFKFGITLKGNPDDYKIRLGGAKFNEKQAVGRVAITDTARVNLLDQIENVFRRGVRRSKFAHLNLSERPTIAENDTDNDPISATDSLLFIQEGLIPAPAGQTEQTTTETQKDKR